MHKKYQKLHKELEWQNIDMKNYISNILPKRNLGNVLWEVVVLIFSASTINNISKYIFDPILEAIEISEYSEFTKTVLTYAFSLIGTVLILLILYWIYRQIAILMASFLKLLCNKFLELFKKDKNKSSRMNERFQYVFHDLSKSVSEVYQEKELSDIIEDDNSEYANLVKASKQCCIEQGYHYLRKGIDELYVLLNTAKDFNISKGAFKEGKELYSKNIVDRASVYVAINMAESTIQYYTDKLLVFNFEDRTPSLTVKFEMNELNRKLTSIRDQVVKKN